MADTETRLRHICEVCGTDEILTVAEAMAVGWDHPPGMSDFGVIGPRMPQLRPQCHGVVGVARGSPRRADGGATGGAGSRRGGAGIPCGGRCTVASTLMALVLDTDTGADAGYVTLSNAPVARTEHAGASVLVDVDSDGSAVGIEILTLTAAVDVDGLAARYGLSAETRGELSAVLNR